MTTLYSLQEVAKYNGQDGANTWLVVKDMVYDVTSYLKEHPGGPELIEEYAGMDATDVFADSHSPDAYKILKKFKIGELVEEDKRANRRKKKTSKNGAMKENANKYGRENVTTRRAFLSVLCAKCA